MHQYHCPTPGHGENNPCTDRCEPRPVAEPAAAFTLGVSAVGMLDAAASIMGERAREYDKAQGERSAAAVAAAWSAVTGKVMTEAEAWLFLQILKQVRLFSAKAFHMDSALDNVAYAALLAESKAKE